jgi:hypothetical protein
MFNWASLVTLLPTLIMGIQAIHGSATAGATKKQLVLESLGLAVGAGETLDPAVTPVATAAGTLIDSFVNMFHAANAPGFGNTAVVAPPASAPAA